MNIEVVDVPGYERVVHAIDPDNGLNAFIAVHDTTLGPALGGLRMLPYASEDEALEDVTRLARAMTYKAAVAQTGQGGGKAVIVGDPAHKTEALLRAMGRFIESFEGRYITAEDMNITVADLEIVARETRWVSGLSLEHGSSGNPSPMTALGCFVALQASLEEVFGDATLEGRRIAIQGAGAVGGRLANLCLDAGMRVAVSDTDPKKIEPLASRGAEPLHDPDDALRYPCDIVAPCARGAILDTETIPKLRCRIVAGAANNQLASPADAVLLQEHGILYAPDYVVNAGGIINIACEFAPGGYSEEAARRRVQSVGSALQEVFRIARDAGIDTASAALRLAESRIAEGRIQG